MLRPIAPQADTAGRQRRHCPVDPLSVLGTCHLFGCQVPPGRRLHIHWRRESLPLAIKMQGPAGDRAEQAHTLLRRKQPVVVEEQTGIELAQVQLTARNLRHQAAARRYLAPLIRGEAYPPYGRDGVPEYVALKNVLVKKQLDSWDD